MKRFVVLIILSILTVLGLLLLHHRSQHRSDGKTAITVDRIVSHLQPVEELATLKVGVSGIVTGSQPGRFFWQGTSRMVLLARGKAIYAIDLSTADVKVWNGRVQISLAPPRLTDWWVDVEETLIWERKRGRLRREPGVQLDHACWSVARQMVHEAAGGERHRRHASEHAERVIVDLLGRAAPELRVEIWWTRGAGD